MESFRDASRQELHDEYFEKDHNVNSSLKNVGIDQENEENARNQVVHEKRTETMSKARERANSSNPTTSVSSLVAKEKCNVVQRRCRRVKE